MILHKTQIAVVRAVALLLFIVGTSVTTSVRNIKPDIQYQIDKYIKTLYLPASNTATLGLGIVQNDGEIIYTTGFGFANQEKEILNSNQTQFLLGSITKSFTALVVIKALSEKWPEMGESVLDTPIMTLLPDSNFILIDKYRTEHVTFRDLLAHRLCIVRDDLQLQAVPFDTKEEIMFRVRYAKDVCGTRTEQIYNNQMFVVLGVLVRFITNRSYEDVAYELLREIGMHSSEYISEADDFPNMPHRAQPYYVKENVAYPFNPELVKRLAPITTPVGGLFTTPDDMTRYLRFHLNLGKIDGKQIIPEEVMMWTRKPSLHLPFSDFKTSDGDIFENTMAYGLALRLGTYDGWEQISHSGYFPSYLGRISMYPALKLGIFTISNQAPVMMDSAVLHAFIFETLRGTRNATEVAEKFQNRERRKHLQEVKEKNEALKAFLRDNTREAHHQSPSEIVGQYGSGNSGELDVYEKFNESKNTTELYLSYGKWMRAWLEKKSVGVYNLIWDSDMIYDDYASGFQGPSMYAAFNNDKLEIFSVTPFGEFSRGKYEKGVSLENLPSMPWKDENCPS